jgi:hypothetical protein
MPVRVALGSTLGTRRGTVLSVLHVRCGDDILGKLEAAGIPGERVKWIDPSWLRLDLGFLGDDAALDGPAARDEIVLWFEHDLWDQAILAALLSRFAARPPRGALTMVDVAPLLAEREGFRGLGELEAEELPPLFDARAPVSDEQVELGRRAWAAIDDPDPDGLEDVLATDTEALPHLRDALIRLCMERRPGSDGLSLTARLALECVAAGAGTPVEAFLAAQDREAAPWMGDTLFFDVLSDLEEKGLLETAGGRLAVTGDGAARL